MADKVPSNAHLSARRFGQLADLELAVGFDEPLPESELQAWEGERPTTSRS